MTTTSTLKSNKILGMAMLIAIFFGELQAFNKVVIWGHKLHTHTHSYIHNAFYRAFTYLGYPTYWFDNKDDVSHFNFSDTLFITEGQVDSLIPIKNDCRYMLHNCSPEKYQSLRKNQFFSFQVYNDTIHQVPNLVKVEPCIYYDLPGRCLYMPWATDLLPHEVEEQKRKLSMAADQKIINWVGTIGKGKFGNMEEINPFKLACEENGIEFRHLGPGSSSIDENIQLMQESYLAPAIVGSWQRDVGYIPCRIFKNISYGKIGLTNSERVYELFEKHIVYNPDTYQLFYDGKKKLESITAEEQLSLMDFIKDKHTYINRINTLLDFLKLIEETYE